MSRESSVLFSLRELKQIEDDRVEDERAAAAERRRREEEARRAAAEEARRRDDEAKRLAAEEARRRDEELAARGRERELESRLRVAEATARAAELAHEEAVRREVLARSDAAVAVRWPLGVKLLVAALALAVIGEGAWIAQRQGARAAVAERDSDADRSAVDRAADCPSVAPAVTPVAGGAPGDPPPVAGPQGPPGPPKIVTPPIKRVLRTHGEGGPDAGVTAKCVCADPRDPLCCL